MSQGFIPTSRLISLHRKAELHGKRAQRAIRRAKVATDIFNTELKAEEERQGVER